MKKVIVIGAGFAGISAATALADSGYEVTVLEKHDGPGGRARQFEAEGFTFDMGPSWYWMPDVFDAYFEHYGKRVSDYYDLRRLDPGYTIWFGEGHVMEVPADRDALYAMFEQYEPGSAKNLEHFLTEAEYKYRTGMDDFVRRPSRSLFEFAEWRVIKAVFRLQMLQSMAAHVEKLFKNEYLRQLLNFPVLFLGATPENTPAMYSLMNYADLALGTWYPMGGMHEIVKAMVALAEEKGVAFKYGHEVQSIYVPNGTAKHVVTNHGEHAADIVIGGADYHHVEQHLLPESKRNYTEKYWESRTMAPSSLLFYMGVDKELPMLHHHNLFFDADFKQHANEIYEDPKWPEKPLFYVCAPSRTDPSVAPDGHENIFVLIPLAADLEDTEALREQYYHMVMDRLEAHTHTEIRSHVVYRRGYAHRDFTADYHAYKSNAYGLANTLRQTAFLKPSLKSKKVSNLYFTGQLTTPGPGVPPSLISGQVVAQEIQKEHPLPTAATPN